MGFICRPSWEVCRMLHGERNTREGMIRETLRIADVGNLISSASSGFGPVGTGTITLSSWFSSLSSFHIFSRFFHILSCLYSEIFSHFCDLFTFWCHFQQSRLTSAFYKIAHLVFAGCIVGTICHFHHLIIYTWVCVLLRDDWIMVNFCCDFPCECLSIGDSKSREASKYGG